VGEWVEPSKQRVDACLAEWVQGQKLSPATLASYRKNIRLHIDPYLGETTVARLSGAAVDAWIRRLEASGRADGMGGLSARTVRYVYTILRSALGDAVRHGRLSANPTDRSTPPSPSEARPPEMQTWTASELNRFLGWADAEDRDLAMGWRLLAATGMRRGEALALRWWDVDLDAGRLAVRRSVGAVKSKGAGEKLVEGPTKTGQSRVVDLDAGTLAALRSYRTARGLLTLDLVRDSALVLSGLDGTHRHPERFSRRFAGQVVRARRALGKDRCRWSGCTTSATPTPPCCSPMACRSRSSRSASSREGHHHAHRLPARAPRHGPRGGRALRRAARRLTPSVEVSKWYHERLAGRA
jgi:integrase